jgi:hypothetical protein
MSKQINKKLLFCPGPNCKNQKRGDRFKDGSFYAVYKESVIRVLNDCLPVDAEYTIKQGDHVCNSCVLAAKRLFESKSALSSANSESTSVKQNSSNIDQEPKNHENQGIYSAADARFYVILRKIDKKYYIFSRILLKLF